MLVLEMDVAAGAPIPWPVPGPAAREEATGVLHQRSPPGLVLLGRAGRDRAKPGNARRSAARS